MDCFLGSTLIERSTDALTCQKCGRRRHRTPAGCYGQWKQLGYEVKLWFLSLPFADVAVSRVEVRVSQGGHNIPEHVIRRRFKAGLHNFHNLYSKAVDSWVVYDSYVQPPKVLDWSDR